MIMMIYEIGCRSEPANEMAKTIAAYLNESSSTTKMSLIKVQAAIAARRSPPGNHVVREVDMIDVRNFIKECGGDLRRFYNYGPQQAPDQVMMPAHSVHKDR
jgi:hypothetical protein